MTRVAARWLSLVSLPLMLCGACAPLEPMRESVCGNRVVEEGEECDTHADWPGAVCKPPSDLSPQCVYSCSADGAEGTCPPDFLCNLDGRCVAPDGTFTPTGAFVGSNAALLEVPVLYFPSVVMLGTDLGDGRRAATAWDYVDFTHASGSALPIGFEMASPTLWSIGAEDVSLEPVSAFVNRALAFVGEHGVQALKRPEVYAPSFVSVAMPAEPAPKSPSREVRVMSVLGSASARSLDGGKSLLELEDGDGGLVFRRVDRPEPPLLDLSWTNKRLADLRGGAVVGDWDARAESPCHEVIVPLDGLDYLLLLSPCAGSSWSDAPELVRIRLPQLEGARNVVTGPARAIDVDLNGALDVVFGASRGPYVAYGRGDGTFSSSPEGTGEPSVAVPLRLALADESSGDALPFDGADLNADGYVDYALPGGIALSQSDGTLFWAHRSPGWAEAKIDRQRGRVLATSPASGIDVLTYLTSAEQFVRSRWGTTLAASHLALGDFDGDATTDVAFAQSSEGAASVWVALGGPRHPEEPEKVADFTAVSDLQAAYLDSASSPPDAVGDLVVSGKLAGREGETFSFLHGNANGEFASPLVLRREDGEREVPLAIAASAFATSPRFLAAVATVPGPSPRPLRLWAFTPDAELGADSLSFSAPLPEGFVPSDASVALRYGAHLAAGDVSGSGVSDLVLVAPYEVPEERSALVVGRLDGPRIETTPPLVLDGVADDLTRLRLADVDGDGWNDVLLRPSGAGERPLWILWNDGAGSFSRDALTELHPSGGVNDFTCDAVSRDACALLVVTSEGVFTVDARGRELELRAIPEAAGGLAIGSFNSLDTSSLLVGGGDATTTYQGGLKRPGMVDAAVESTPQ